MKPKQISAKWFDNSMSRASSTFGTKMKTLSIVVALFIAISANVDTLHIGRTLWEDPLLRQQISAVATQAVESGQLEAAINEAEQANQEAGNAETGADGVVEDIANSAEAVGQTLEEISSLRLPIGWLLEDVSDSPEGSPLRSNPNNLWLYFPWNNPNGWLGLLLAKIMGIAATVISASQGAPFWFNILNKIMGK